MHGYKKKLLDRYPGPKETIPPTAAPMPPAVSSAVPEKKAKSAAVKLPRPEPKENPSPEPRNINELRQAFDAEQRLDEIRSSAGQVSASWTLWKNILVTAAAALVSALLGLWAGTAWMEARLRPNWEHELSELQKQASLKLDRFLSSREIQALLEDKARAAGEKTAEQEVRRLTAEAITPSAEKMDAGAKKLEAQGEAVLSRLKGLSEFMLLELRAKNDDRKAFEELLTVSRDRAHPYREIAAQAVSQIFILVTSLNVQDPSLAAREGEPSAASYVSFDQFKATYRDALSLNRPRLLSEMNASRQFNDAQKTAFLLEVIRGDSSLRAMAWACRLLDEKAKIYKPFTAYEKYLEWGARSSIPV